MKPPRSIRRSLVALAGSSAAAIALFPSALGAPREADAAPEARSASVVRVEGSRSIPASLRASAASTKRTTAARRKAAARRRAAARRKAQRAKLAAVTNGPLRFGIYPGGGAGAVGPRGEPIPEDPVKRIAALETLRGSSARPFVLHLYEAYERPSDADRVPTWLAPQIAEATRKGFQVELVLRYRPAAAGGDVPGFLNYVRARVRQLGPDRGVTALQIGNEANIEGAPDAADGAYAGARQALAKGVIAADQELRKRGFNHLQIGFNWAYGTDGYQPWFFDQLRRIGGKAFAAATDWVAIDAYPGTWGPELTSSDLETGVRDATIDAMRRLREDLMPKAGVGNAAIRFAESGFPTGAGRDESAQSRVMAAAITTINEHRVRYGVTDYRWFDLRDADSTYASFESHYGITYDDYRPKPAFWLLRDLTAQFGG